MTNTRNNTTLTAQDILDAQEAGRNAHYQHVGASRATPLVTATTLLNDTLSHISTDNVLFRVLGKNGKEVVVIERQMSHDPQYKVGSRIPGRGKVTEVIGRGRG